MYITIKDCYLNRSKPYHTRENCYTSILRVVCNMEYNMEETLLAVSSILYHRYYNDR